MCIGMAPLFPFNRRFSNVSNALSDETRTAIRATLASLLVPCGVSTQLVGHMSDLAIFLHAYREANKRPSSLGLNPIAFAEEMQWVQYQLVAFPGPFREGVRPTAVQPNVLCELAWGDFIDNHRHPLPEPILPNPAEPFLGALLRLCALSYIKETFPE